MTEKHHGEDSADHSDGMTATAAPVITAAPTKPKPRKLPLFRVLLHNDEVNTFEYVISSVRRLTPLAMEEAVLKALEAHETGVSLLLVTHQERAELYAEQFTSMKISVSIEPDRS